VPAWGLHSCECWLLLVHTVVDNTDSPDSSDDGYETESPMPLDSVDSVDEVEQREPVLRDDDDAAVVWNDMTVSWW